MYQKSIKGNPFSLLIGIVLFFAFIWLAVKAIQYVFIVLSVIAPFLLIAAWVMDKTVVINYWDKLMLRIKEDWATGVLRLIINVLGFPVVAAYLVGKILVKRKFSKEYEKAFSSFGGGNFGQQARTNNQKQRLNQQPKEEEYTDYEIVD